MAMTPRDAFPGYDEPVNIDMEPKTVKLLVDADEEQGEQEVADE